jgi:hypothetical protein
MNRSPALLGGLLGLLLLLHLAIALRGSQVDWGPDFTVADLRSRLAARPAAWVGRTVVVRAIAEPCPWWGAAARLLRCDVRALVLVGTPAEAPADPLPLVQPAPMGIVSVVRGLPILGALLHRPPAVPLFTRARFRVRLLALPAGSGASCYEALLLDAGPYVRGEA